MTITVTDIDQGPFIATSLAQAVPYTFMTLTPSEISVFYEAGAGRVLIDPALYTVDPNVNVDGSPLEGGEVNLLQGAAPGASAVYLRAKPFDEREIVWSDNASRLRNLNDENDRQVIRLLVVKQNIVDLNDVLAQAIADAGSAIGLIDKVDKIANTVTVNIPGSYANLQTAIDTLSKRFSGNNVRIILNCTAPLTGGYLVRDGNYGRFYVVNSADAGVPGAVALAVDAAFTGYSDIGLTPASNNRTRNLFVGYNAIMPVLSCRVDMGHYGDSGYYGVWGCNGFVLPFCGVTNAGFNGLEFRCGVVQAYETTWDGALNSGIRAAYTSNITAQSATADNCCQAPETPNAGAIDISRTSTIHFRSGSAQNSGANGANIRRAGRCVFEFADFSGAAYNGCEVGDATIFDAYGMVADNCGSALSPGGGGFGLVITSGSCGTVFGGRFKNNHGDGVAGRDIQLGENASAGGSSDFSGVETTDGVNAITNIRVAGGSNTISCWNTPTQAGILFNKYMPAPAASWGVYSSTGASNGKMVTANAFQSSRSSTALQTHMTFNNPNGEVASISTLGSSGTFNTTSDETLKDFYGEYSGEEALALILSDPSRLFRFVADDPDSDMQVGFGAQTSFSKRKDLATPGGWFDPISGEPAEPMAKRWVWPDTGMPAEEDDVLWIDIGTQAPVVGEKVEGYRYLELRPNCIAAHYRPWTINMSARIPHLWAAVAHLAGQNEAMDARIRALEGQDA